MRHEKKNQAQTKSDFKNTEKDYLRNQTITSNANKKIIENNENFCSSKCLLEKIKSKLHFRMNSIVTQSANPYNNSSSSHLSKLSKDGRYSHIHFFAFKGNSKRIKNQEFNVYQAILNDKQIGNSNDLTAHFKPIHIEDSIHTSTPVTNKDFDFMTLLNYYGDFREFVKKTNTKKNITKRNEKDNSIAGKRSLTSDTADMYNTSDIYFLKKRLPVRMNQKNPNRAKIIEDSIVSPESHCPEYSPRTLPKCVEKFNKKHDNLSTTYDRQKNKNMSYKTQHTCKKSEISAEPKSQSSYTTADSGYIQPEIYKDKRLKTKSSNNCPTIPLFYTKHENALEKKYKQMCDNYVNASDCCTIFTEENICTTPTLCTKNINAVDNKNKKMSDKFHYTICYCTSFTEENISTTPTLYTININAQENKNKQTCDNSSSTSSTTSCRCTSSTEENIFSMDEEHTISNNKITEDKCCSCETLVEKKNGNNEESKNEIEKTLKNAKTMKCIACNIKQKYIKLKQKLIKRISKDAKVEVRNNESKASAVYCLENLTEHRMPKYYLSEKEKKLANGENNSLNPIETCKRMCECAKKVTCENENNNEPVTGNVRVENIKEGNADADEVEITCPVCCIKKLYTIGGKKKAENQPQFCAQDFTNPWSCSPPRFMSFGDTKKQAPRQHNINIDLTYMRSTLKLLIIALALSPCILCCLCCYVCISKCN